jgi:hypothetical protein
VKATFDWGVEADARLPIVGLLHCLIDSEVPERRTCLPMTRASSVFGSDLNNFTIRIANCLVRPCNIDA